MKKYLMPLLYSLALASTIPAMDALTLKGRIVHNEGYIHTSVEEGHIGVLISQHGYIGTVRPESPAEQAGLQRGDVVKEVDGKPNNVDAIVGIPGTLVVLKVFRSGVMYNFVIRRVDHREIKLR